MTPDLLEELGYENEGDLRDAVQTTLDRQLVYHQQQQVRRQVTALLTSAATWDLPPEMLERQSRREMERAKLEMKRSGFSDEQILTNENRLRQSTSENTARALKEHFILERIAEEEKIEDAPGDYDEEIRLIAAQSGDSPRRVRAELERRDLMDVVRNQIIENKTIQLILSQADFKDVPFVPDRADVESVDQAAGGEEEKSEIPEAKHGGDAEPLRSLDQQRRIRGFGRGGRRSTATPAAARSAMASARDGNARDGRPGDVPVGRRFAGTKGLPEQGQPAKTGIGFRLTHFIDFGRDCA